MEHFDGAGGDLLATGTSEQGPATMITIWHASDPNACPAVDLSCASQGPAHGAISDVPQEVAPAMRRDPDGAVDVRQTSIASRLQATGPLPTSATSGV